MGLGLELISLAKGTPGIKMDGEFAWGFFTEGMGWYRGQKADYVMFVLYKAPHKSHTRHIYHMPVRLSCGF